jgi:hypothetical protein
LGPKGMADIQRRATGEALVRVRVSRSINSLTRIEWKNEAK